MYAQKVIILTLTFITRRNLPNSPGKRVKDIQFYDSQRY